MRTKKQPAQREHIGRVRVGNPGAPPSLYFGDIAVFDLGRQLLQGDLVTVEYWEKKMTESKYGVQSYTDQPRPIGAGTGFGFRRWFTFAGVALFLNEIDGNPSWMLTYGNVAPVIGVEFDELSPHRLTARPTEAAARLAVAISAREIIDRPSFRSPRFPDVRTRDRAKREADALIAELQRIHDAREWRWHCQLNIDKLSLTPAGEAAVRRRGRRVK